jgi:branched-chain amino acid transport system permease protein
LGYAAIPSFGQAAFFGTGAYTVALLAPLGVPVPLVVIASLAIAGVLAAAVGLATLRATGIAFAMVTLAISQALYTIVFHGQFLGGENGFPGITASDLGPLHLAEPRVFWFVLVTFCVLGIAGYRLMVTSPFGSALLAIREDPKRAAAMGLNIRAYRVGAFVLAGCGGGVAGSLFAYANQIVTPEALYWTQSANPLIMALMGGVRSFVGPLLGALVYTAMLHELSQLTHAFLLFVGLIFLLFLFFLPEGLISAPAQLRLAVSRWRRGSTQDQVA